MSSDSVPGLPPQRCEKCQRFVDFTVAGHRFCAVHFREWRKDQLAPKPKPKSKKKRRSK